MRITHNSQMKNYLTRMNTSLKNLNDSNDRLASQRSLNKSSDNVLDATRALRVRNQLDNIDIYRDNIRDAQSRASTAEDSVKFLTSTLRTTTERLVQGMNGTYNESDRVKIGEELRNLQEESLQVLNAKYADKYLFNSAGGANGNEQPFTVGEDGRLLYHGYDVDTMQKFGNTVMVPETSGEKWATECGENGDPVKYIVKMPTYRAGSFVAVDKDGNTQYEEKTLDRYTIDEHGNYVASGTVTINVPLVYGVENPRSAWEIQEMTNHIKGYGEDTAWMPEVDGEGRAVVNTIKQPQYYTEDLSTTPPTRTYLTYPEDLELVYNENGSVQHTELDGLYVYEWNDKANIVQREADPEQTYTFPYYTKTDANTGKEYVYEISGQYAVEHSDVTNSGEYYFIDSYGTPVIITDPTTQPGSSATQCYRMSATYPLKDIVGDWQPKQAANELGKLEFTDVNNAQFYMDRETEKVLEDPNNAGIYNIYRKQDIDEDGAIIPGAVPRAQGVTPVYEQVKMNVPLYKNKQTGQIMYPSADNIPDPYADAGADKLKYDMYKNATPEPVTNYVPFKKFPYNDVNYLDTGFGLKANGWGAESKIDSLSVYRYSYSGIELFGYGCDQTTGTPNNVYSLLGAAKNALESDNINVMGDCLTKVNDTLDTILVGLTDIGERYNYLSTTDDRLTNENVNYSSIQTKLEGVDVAEESMYNKSYNMAWMVTLQLGSKVLPTSLWDFLR